ncbi:hypothetical protein B0J15DRAFT_417623 [Fusarium solani]|uniref:F-box domain-containing protein n=1 Tax=Fusarium solani TaxID=169388 RepID=A0A9P9KZ37_FUSSL|nr:uncharacterized protein B0J15DRAFT_417623 [Fusarium solani]KAH7271258.1 hypothetical protein B0J15DRAFT_417623 [Fusarium solani]
MEKKSLVSLPDDLILDIVEYLDTARDVAHVAALSRRTQGLIHQDGWRTFVKTRFPSLDVPTGLGTSWGMLADRATYLDKCWEKRGFWMNVLYEKKQQPGRFQRRVSGSQSVLFHSVLDARLSSSHEEEIIAAGVGENLLVRVKPVDKRQPDVWHQLQGQALGYRAGTGDVTAVSVIEDEETAGVVVGRANGDIQVLSAKDNFTTPLRNLKPADDTLLNHASDPMRKSPGQLAVSSLQWHSQSNLLASGKGSVLTLHDLNTSETSPVAYYDFSQASPNDEASLLRSAKFMSKDVVACALGGSRNPLRWGQLTPTGIQFSNAATNPRPLDDAAALTEVRLGEKTTIRAIEPVRGGGNENLLLSAWDDGTYRLFDIRTPSAQDAVYRDRFQPYEAGSSLLVYGTERFVAGSNTAPDIRLFDFRYPKPYHHTTALPCSAQWPFPSQKDDHKMWRSGWAPECQQCRPADGTACPWHGLSRRNYWRPDATLHIGSPTLDRIYCLAKASDLSETVYCGLRGAILEMNLHLTSDAAYDEGPRTTPAGWRMGRPGGKISLIETGVSLCQAKEWSLDSRGVPELIVQRPQPQAQQTGSPDQMKRHRLDSAFHRLQDFQQAQG